ncbi:putative uncharacterized protein [Coraliomargarita sp. CAG:312]|jgi:hypothetical protein|nr:putative uncharacterized protein [Coraliomargarita sp. CAG:312]
MDANTVFDATSAIGSAGAGFFAAIISQIIKAKMEHDEKMITLLGQRVEIADSSADKAAARTGDAGKIIRRMIYFGCAFTIIVAPFIFAFFSSIPVQVEERRIIGGWLFGLIPEWSSTSFHAVQGFYLPDSIQKAFISYLIPFYLGRGAASVR